MSNAHTDSCSADDNPRSHPPAHQDFRWIAAPLQGTPYGDLLEIALDAINGIHTCLQIAYASDLARAANADADAGQTEAPAVGIVESDQLVRMSMVMAASLRTEILRRIDIFNTSAATAP